MNDEQIIETAMHVHTSKRDAIWWAMKQVRMQANTHQLSGVSEQNTHQTDDVARQLVEALKHCTGWVEAYGRSELRREVRAALAAAKDAGL